MFLTSSRRANRAAHAGFLPLIATALALSGCGILPKDGPTGFQVRTDADVRVEDSGRLSYAFVKLTPLTVSTLQTERQPPVLFDRLSRLTTKADGRLGASDVVSVSIFEAGAGGLFIPAEGGSRTGNFITIPAQEIDRNGNIDIPYAGQIRALGRTPQEISASIVDKLKTRAIEPQAIVSVGERSSNGVTMIGDVKSPGVVPLRPGGMKLLQGLARVGGPAGPPYSTVVSLQRRGRTENALLTSIIDDPKQNIELAPEDVINVTNVPRIYMAFGAVGSGGSAINIGLGAAGSSTPGRRFPIDRANMPLTEAIAAAGGISSGSADPQSVFLFRYTPRKLLEKAGVDVSAFPGPEVPTVYMLDVGQTDGYFIAQDFYIKHNDIIYVSESPITDLSKFLGVINLLTSTAFQYRL